LDALTRIVSNDDAGGPTSKVNFVAAAESIYLIAVDGYNGNFGNLKLSLDLLGGLTAPLNDNYGSAAFISNAPIALTASNYLATVEAGELRPTTNGGSSLWWLWEAPVSGHFIVSTAGSDFDTILSVYKSGTLVTWNDDATGHASVVRFNARAGARYHISVQGYRGAMGVLQLSIVADPPKPAPLWTLLDMDGKVLNSSNFLGKVVMLDFWATWCGPCIEEVPHFIAMQEKYRADGLVIIGVSTDPEGFEVVRPFVESWSVNYISTVVTPQIERDYGPVQFIPSTYIIDRGGMIVDKFVGVYSQKSFEDAILPLLYPEISMQFSRAGSDLLLRWPASSTGYIVQAATNLIPANWSNLFVPINVSDENNVARIPLSGANRYFRLVHH
jgi:thiol-disulfide isomerase/thioredoxin